LWPFYDGIKNGVGSVMCGMNRVNESYACENAQLLNKYLKTEIGFPGIVIADVSGKFQPTVVSYD
jgi:beta-glucosidase